MESFKKYFDESGEHLSHDTVINYNSLKDSFTAEEISFIDSHLQNCKECNAKVKSNENVNTSESDLSLNYIRKESVPGSNSRLKKYFNHIKYTSFILFFALVFIIMFYDPDAGKRQNNILVDRIPDTMDISLQNPLDNQSPENNNAKVYTEKDVFSRQDVPEAFFYNVLLENFMHQSRTETRKITITSPALDELVTSSISFKWKMNSSAGNLQFVIVDNKNTSLYNSTVSGSGLTIEKRFKDGLYYWKIYSAGNLEAVGRFIVRK